MVRDDFRAYARMPTLTEKGKEISIDIMSGVYNKFAKLIDVRNKFLHATWRIGFQASGSPDGEGTSDELYSPTPVVQKYRTGKSGFKAQDEMPQSANKLSALGNTAARLWLTIDRFIAEFEWHPEQIENVYSKINGEWEIVYPHSVVSHSPKPKASRRKSTKT